ncbi:GNAT family N-acetyltransferase [Methylocystis parvus]|uniref:GNAT family N-acetyltransferase n=1 Tax=Methylocystis parvus TaxID=134 RepID=A0A6B8MCC7_9HYPH|nr:GNAT family N-acetyltransferase [Methylocystis parvus]QGM98973.1 GNAT family N-acetyltransferase [Methylocystis parvus]WBK00667.1 GNAT family N-acetyltransferase [Methylocystis parvus OBBP]
MTRFYSVELDNRDRGSFVCGNDKIDHYFQCVIKQDVKRDYAACYVLVERESERLAGFYTLSSSGVPLTELPPELVRKLPRYPSVPAVLIGWLARDRSFAGEGVGTLLLYDAFTRLSRSPVGAYAVFVDAIDEKAIAFYRSFGFISFSNRSSSLFLPLATIRSLVAES